MGSRMMPYRQLGQTDVSLDTDSEDESGPRSPNSHDSCHVTSHMRVMAISSERSAVCRVPERKSWKIRDIRVFVAVGCLYVVSAVLVEMYFVAVITTLEKRFGFRSSSSGMLLSIKEIAYVCVVTIASHFGSRWHRPYFLSIMGVILSLGSIIAALPHLIFDKRNEDNILDKLNSSSRVDRLCTGKSQTGDLGISTGSESINGSSPTDQCLGDDVSTTQNEAYIILAVSYAIIGVAISPMIALTTTYVDDACGPRRNALFLGKNH